MTRWLAVGSCIVDELILDPPIPDGWDRAFYTSFRPVGRPPGAPRVPAPILPHLETHHVTHGPVSPDNYSLPASSNQDQHWAQQLPCSELEIPISFSNFL